jgi:hypothetical protein
VPVQSDLVWQNDHLLGTGKTSEPMCLRTRYHKTTRTGLIQINPAAVAIQSNIRFKAVSLFPACLPSSYDLLDVELEYSKCGHPDPFSLCLYPIPDRRHPTSVYQPPTLWQNCSGFCLHTV